jgi:hypothetical protein
MYPFDPIFHLILEIMHASANYAKAVIECLRDVLGPAGIELVDTRINRLILHEKFSGPTIKKLAHFGFWSGMFALAGLFV